MGEKSPRRAAMNFTAEKLDYKNSLARTDNKRIHNRLMLEKSYIKDHENANLNSMNYEMRKLKHELRGIRQTSGYFYVEDEVKTAKKKERTSKGKHSPTKRQNLGAEAVGSQEESCKQTNHEFSETLNLPNLPKITSSTSLGNEIQSQSLTTDSVRQKNQNRKSSLGKITTNTTVTGIPAQNSSSIEISVTSVNEDILEESFESNTLRPSSRGLSKSESSLVMDLDGARDRIQNRLAGRHMTRDDTDVTPYMHVPPDGLPRTVYLLPPLEDLLQEAKKARYIRKLRKHTTEYEKDDLERELDIDEIFSRK